jgi:antitoxin MazE
LLEQTNLGEEVELELQEDQIIVRPTRHARHDWEDAFQAMAERGGDKLLDGDVLVSTAWDEDEWEW